MAVAYRNTTGAPATLTLEVYDTDGNLMEVPYLAKGNGVARHNQVNQELVAYGSGVFATSASKTSYRKGWMRIVSRPAGAIAVTALAARMAGVTRGIVSRPAGAIAVTAHSRTRNGNGGLSHLFSLQAVPSRRIHSIGPFDNGSVDEYLIANNSSEAD